MRTPGVFGRFILALALSVVLGTSMQAAAVAEGASAPTVSATNPNPKPKPKPKPRAKPRAGAPQPNTRLTGSRIYGAASLGDVFPAMAPRETYSFAGSDQLAFQIQQGAPADVFASANVKYTDQLYAKGLVEQPVTFVYNHLVLIVPKANPGRIVGVEDVAKPGIKLVIGDANVPVGSYTRTVLSRLKLNAALTNVVSNEPDVRGVLTKVVLGEADAGFVYFSDFYAQRYRLTFFGIPADAQPAVAYSIAVVKSSKNVVGARQFVGYMLSEGAKRFFRKYGFTVT